MSSLATLIVKICTEASANSDIHLHEGQNVAFRDSIGHMQVVPDTIVTGEDFAALINDEWSSDDAAAGSAVDQLLEKLVRHNFDMDQTVVAGKFRFRANVFMHGGEQLLGATLRRVRDQVPTFADLGLDESLKTWLDNRSGLVLITGPSGSGKTSTLAACVNYLNTTRKYKIVILEDPIEYVHTPVLSVITQRQIGRDCESFPKGLVSAMRQDPDVIVVGEIRDTQTIETALKAAETGHLVLATLHATAASRAPERVIDNCTDATKSLAKAQLSASLIGVLAQMLVPNFDGSGKVLATEAMTNNSEVAAYIRTGNFGQLDNAMAHGGEDPNLWLLNMRLIEMIMQGHILIDDAMDATNNRADLLERHHKLVSNGNGAYSSYGTVQ